MDNLRKTNFEPLLYILAILLAFTVRFYKLGSAPLSDQEAAWAMQALQLSRGEAVSIGPQPAYVILTSILFYLFQSSNFLARFWPALLGSLLVLTPWMLSRALPVPGTRYELAIRLVLLITAFGLALDPGLAATSRLAGSPVMALAFTVLSVSAWIISQPILAGVLAGLALLSGPAFYQGLLSLVIAWSLAGWLTRGSQPQGALEETVLNGDVAGSDMEQPHPHEKHLPWNKLTPALVAAGVTVLLLGTFFLRYPQGIAAWAASLSAYIAGWVNNAGDILPELLTSETSPQVILAALAIYEILPLVFGLIGGLSLLLNRAQPRQTIFFVLWFMFALVLTLLYPARQVTDLIWALVPLWALAAMQITAYQPQEKTHPVSIIQALSILFLSALLWYSLANISAIPTTGNALLSQAGVILGILSLAALATLLVALGWSWQVSRLGLAWGAIAALSLYSFAMLWWVTQLRPQSPQELWTGQSSVDQSELFLQTLYELSYVSTGSQVNLAIQSTYSRPSLRWALRNFPNARFLTQLDESTTPEVIITHDSQSELNQAAAYRGQDFTWLIQPGWEGAFPPDFLRWLTFREAPLLSDKLILWARSDLFPGYTPDEMPGTSNEQSPEQIPLP